MFGTYCLIALASVSVTACSGSSGGPPPRQANTPLPAALHMPLRNTGVVLFGYATRDTIRAEDSLIVVTLLRNDGAPLSIRNYPDFYDFTVLNAQGHAIAPTLGDYSEWNLGTRSDLILAHGGILGQITNLTCERQPYAPDPGQSPCLLQYHLSLPGDYRIVVRYGPKYIVGAAIPAAGPQLMSDTVRITYIAAN